MVAMWNALVQIPVKLYLAGKQQFAGIPILVLLKKRKRTNIHSSAPHYY